jgi:hypothetical protein
MSSEQRAQGRRKAIASRRARARIKGDLRSGRISGSDVIGMVERGDEAGRVAARLRIGELLVSVPGVGPATAEEVLRSAGISGQRRLGQLGPRQIEKLGGLL